MENIKEFIERFNKVSVENQSDIKLLTCGSTGFCDFVSLEMIGLWDDCNNPSQYFEEFSLATLVEQLSPLLNKASLMLRKKMEEHAIILVTQIKLRYPDTIISYKVDGRELVLNISSVSDDCEELAIDDEIDDFLHAFNNKVFVKTRYFE